MNLTRGALTSPCTNAKVGGATGDKGRRKDYGGRRETWEAWRGKGRRVIVEN